MYKESNNNNKKTFEIKLQLSSANAKKIHHSIVTPFWHSFEYEMWLLRASAKKW